jgi:hypothetical protein
MRDSLRVLLLILLSGLASAIFHPAFSSEPLLFSRLQTDLDIAIALSISVLTIILLIRCPKHLWAHLPYSGLLILCFLYSLFGWTLGAYNSPWFYWIAVLMAAAAVPFGIPIQLGMIGLRSLILSLIAIPISIFAPQPAGHIARLSAIGLATLTAWLWSVSSAKYRMETTGIERRYILWILVSVSGFGLWLGWFIDTFAIPKIGEWVVQKILTPSFQGPL